MKNLNIKACLIACLFFSLNSFSKVLVDEHHTTGVKKFSFSEACKIIHNFDSPLIDIINATTLSCMGKKVNTINFCDKAMPVNPYLSRAKIIDNEIYCYSAKRVRVKWKCEGSRDNFCKDISVGCFLIKEKLARRLKLIHSSLTKNKILNCYFEKIRKDEIFNLD